MINNNNNNNNKCKYCNSSNFKTIQRATDIRYTGDKFFICECIDCGVAFTAPEINLNNIGEYYPSNYGAYTNARLIMGEFHLSKKLFESLNLMRKIIRRVMKSYSKSLYQECNNSKRIYIVGNYLLSFILDVIGKSHIYQKTLPVGLGTKNLLYIGSGSPKIFAEYQAYHDINIHTIDINKDMCDAYNKVGIQSHCGNILSSKFKSKKFDVIYFTHVIEHLLNPRDEILILKNYLSVDGVIVCGFPDHASIEWNTGPTYYDVPRHQIHLTPKTAEMIFKNSELVVKKKIYTPYGWGLYQNKILFQYINNKINKEDFIKEFSIKRIPVKYRIASYFLSLFNQSGNVIFYLKHKSS